MSINPPKLFLKSSLSEDDASKLPGDVWQISAPSKNSLIWSLILSYVMAFGRTDVWTRGYELLLGNSPERANVMKKKNINTIPDQNRLKNQVLGFNPFLSRFSIYFNDEMKKVLRVFDLRLNRYGNDMRSRNDQWDNAFKLKAAAKMLESQIILITINNSRTTDVNCYGETSSNKIPKLIIFLKKGVLKDEKLVDAYAFGMSLEHSAGHRLKALEHVLKKTDIDVAQIRQIKASFPINGDFLQFILNSEWNHIIPIIYKSPYIAWKLADAGFNTDPCARERGLSAFAYCLGKENTRFLQILYNYAVNNFHKSDDSLRNPSENVLECMKNVYDSITQDRANSNDFSNLGNRKHVALKTCHEILYFNEYQTLCVKKIYYILSTTKYIAPHIITSLLHEYSKHFHCQGIESNFENHITYSYYYENVDFFTCLMFFDRVLSLNPDINTSNFKDTVSNLFMTILSYKNFPICEHGYNCSICQLTIDNCPLRFVSYNQRNKFKEFGEQYLMELQSPDESDNFSEDTNKKLTHVRQSLSDHPEITDEFLIRRLERYLKSATEVSLDTDGVKGLLTIERALQVTGETLNSSREGIIAHLVNSCLADGIAHNIHKIRNDCLSHYRPNVLYGRIHLETDIEMFKRLQEALTAIYNRLIPVYLSQDYRTEDILIRKSEIDCEIYCSNTYRNVLKQRELIQTKRKNQCSAYGREYRSLYVNILNTMQKFIEKSECEKLNEKRQQSNDNSKKSNANSKKSNGNSTKSNDNKKKSNGKSKESNADSKKSNENRKNIAALKFLLPFVQYERDVTLANELSSCVEALEILLVSDEENKDQLKCRVLQNISKQKNMLTDTVQNSELTNQNSSEFDKYFNDVKNYRWFSNQEVQDIADKVKVHLERSKKAKEDLKEQLKKNTPPSEEDAKKLIDHILISTKTKKTLLEILKNNSKSALRYLGSIKDLTVFKDLDTLSVFSTKEEGLNLLLRLELPKDLEKKMLKFLNRNLECLLDRIHHLKSILIDEDEEIQIMWRWGKSSEIQKHTRHLMGQRYILEGDVRGSLEMLLFDCFNILSKKELEDLWKKATNLFSGVSLRDVLAHGSTMMEVVGGLLDPEDLPSQLIGKILKLIEDGEILKKMSDHWKDKKVLDQAELQGIIDEHIKKKKLSPEKSEEELRRLKEYLSLFPLK
ncbi:hypothetical protein JTE90_014442 [Oedothorax gibbosus]|uniref:Uncharacterized protein n=1 Tax=Oedothorax gibbosus TaxID=931172 RepID=A0AAV6V395_9ARAC|nr:hypothetical protein JTE90_014442 [Oedothorax gibbosus]